MNHVERGTPAILHTLPGRLRLSLPGLAAEETAALVGCLRAMRGIHAARLNALTGNLLVLYDPAIWDAAEIVERVAARPAPAAPPAPRAGARTRIVERRSSHCCHAWEPAENGPRTVPAQHGRDTGALLLRAAALLVRVLLAESPLGWLVEGLELLTMALRLAGGEQPAARLRLLAPPIHPSVA